MWHVFLKLVESVIYIFLGSGKIQIFDFATVYAYGRGSGFTYPLLRKGWVFLCP